MRVILSKSIIGVGAGYTTLYFSLDMPAPPTVKLHIKGPSPHNVNDYRMSEIVESVCYDTGKDAYTVEVAGGYVDVDVRGKTSQEAATLFMAGLTPYLNQGWVKDYDNASD